jgi:predicted O-methyltransferase YrrM
MALALPDVAITALDKNPEWTKIAQKYWEEAGVSSRIELKIGQALEHLPGFPDQYFDLIFIDADKRNYINYYEEALRLVKNTGIIVIDNVLWNGRVADPSHTDLGTNTIRDLNNIIKNDDRVDISMVPIGDGITLVKKKAY